jgi:hypothetical protein
MSELTEEQAKLYSSSFNMSNFRNEKGAWMADDIYTMEREQLKLALL